MSAKKTHFEVTWHESELLTLNKHTKTKLKCGSDTKVTHQTVT